MTDVQRRDSLRTQIDFLSEIYNIYYYFVDHI
jgi:hypothetical protein